MYYGMIAGAVLLFGLQFQLNNKYQGLSGNTADVSFLFSFIYSIAGGLFLFALNGFSLGWTWFTVCMASAAAANSICYIFCSLKAFERISLSLYSLFAMLGGMLLPFLLGLVFFGEKLTVGKILCVGLIFLALSLTVKEVKMRDGWIYYVGVFFLNGMAGVLSKLYGEAPFEKGSSAVYSIWIAICTALISGVILLLMHKRIQKPDHLATLCAAGYGACNCLGNYWLVTALAFVPASVQYPFVTGGVIIVSVLFAAFSKQKPQKREYFATAISFVGLLLLMLC